MKNCGAQIPIHIFFVYSQMHKWREFALFFIHTTIFLYVGLLSEKFKALIITNASVDTKKKNGWSSGISFFVYGPEVQSVL